jgi:hypothetical protein
MMKKFSGGVQVGGDASGGVNLGVKIINNTNVLAESDKRIDEVRADETGATKDDDSPGVSSV